MKTILRSVLCLALVWPGVASAQQSLPATDVLTAAIQATLQEQRATGRPVVDTPIRTVDAGGHNVGVGLVRRTGPAQGGSALHDKVAEVYYIIEGAGTLVTGGSLVGAERRESANATVTGINGPGISGTSIANGASRRIAKGDVVIIPAGTPHWWSTIDTPEIYYIVVRVDPERVVALK
jgi:mannose-6-phosphate isomerase-like protein (cupin superfamily)